MPITLNAATEERIQRQLDRGTFPGPTELLAHASTSSKQNGPPKTGSTATKKSVLFEP